MPRTGKPLVVIRRNEPDPIPNPDPGEPRYPWEQPRNPALWLERRLTEFVRTKSQILEEAKESVDQWSGGVYFLCNGEHIDYVGLTNQGVWRFDQHRKNGKTWDRIYTIDVPFTNVMPIVEWPYIMLVNSPLNIKRTHPYSGDGVHEKLMEKIREVWE